MFRALIPLLTLALLTPLHAQVIDWEAGVEGEQLADHLQAVSPPGVTIKESYYGNTVIGGTGGGQRGGGTPEPEPPGPSDSLFISLPDSTDLGVSLQNARLELQFKPQVQTIWFEVYGFWSGGAEVSDGSRDYNLFSRSTGSFFPLEKPFITEVEPLNYELPIWSPNVFPEVPHVRYTITGPIHRLTLFQSTNSTILGDIHYTIPEPATAALLLTTLAALVTRRR